MKSFDELEPHASYNALMELLEEPDRYTRNHSSSPSRRKKNRDKYGNTGIGKLEAVKDALKFIINEDYEENKHNIDFKQAGKNDVQISEQSVKVRNLQRMRLTFERAAKRVELAKETMKSIVQQEQEIKTQEESDDLVTKTLKSYKEEEKRKMAMSYDAD